MGAERGRGIPAKETVYTKELRQEISWCVWGQWQKRNIGTCVTLLRTAAPHSTGQGWKGVWG